MQTRIVLFCFPYAGGSASIYERWKPFLHSCIDLVPVELAGRGRRVQDQPYKDLQDAVEDALRIIRRQVVQVPYALFGHSLGGIIVYELAQKIREMGLPRPCHLFISGQCAPHLRKPDGKLFHQMQDEAFKKEIRELGGTPPEFFEHPELMELFLPMLRNDFRLAESVTREDRIRPLNTGITVFLGKNDRFDRDQCDGWNAHTERGCQLHYFEGGHFFLHQQTERMTNIINSVLN